MNGPTYSKPEANQRSFVLVIADLVVPDVPLLEVRVGLVVGCDGHDREGQANRQNQHHDHLETLAREEPGQELECESQRVLHGNGVHASPAFLTPWGQVLFTPRWSELFASYPPDCIRQYFLNIFYICQY